MNSTRSTRHQSEQQVQPLDYDFLIIGAGVCGLYQLQRLRELGVRVAALEANGNVGGTWYRNRYPGCRFDSESFTYAYSFSEELLNEWNWTERYAPRGETLEYLNYVADKFSLRSHIQFNTKVVSAVFRETDSTWTVRTEDGRSLTTRFLMTAMGMLSVPTSPRLPGIERFQGRALHTFDWPAEGLDLAGKRVAVLGTGATGVQVISAIANEVQQLTVLQRDANWSAPLGNAPLSPDEMESIKANYEEIFRRCFESPNGFIHTPDRRRSTEVSREERLATWNRLYREPGFGIWLGNFVDTLFDEAANKELTEFVAERIRERVKDPAVAEVLIPKDHGFGTKRVPLETNYLEVYNQSNVELIDLNTNPVVEVTETGICVQGLNGQREIPLDVLIFATGFDAVTGAFDRIDFVGRDGVRLRDKWRDGPTTLLGVATHMFPNLLMCVGPQSGSVAANFPRGIEDIVGWMTDLADFLQTNGITRIEATVSGEDDWVKHVAEINSRVLMSKTQSWFNGYNQNLDRDARPRLLIYTGGAVRYRKALAEEATAGYPRFIMTSG